MDEKKSKQHTQVRVPNSVMQDVYHYARREGRSGTNFVVRAVEEKIKRARRVEGMENAQHTMMKPGSPGVQIR